MTDDRNEGSDGPASPGSKPLDRAKIRTGALAIFICFLVACAGVAWFAWDSTRDSDISGHGLAAMILGGVLTLGLGFGLMFLVFLSNRRGYDDLDRVE